MSEQQAANHTRKKALWRTIFLLATRLVRQVIRLIAAEVDWSQYSHLGTLGLDEIALRKGHRDFVVIVTARLADGQVVLLGVLADRRKETVAKFLRSIPARLKSTVHTACCDMYEGDLEALHEELPQAKVVIDRFHVAKTYREDLDTLRKSELKRLKAQLSKSEYEPLKGSLWAVRKRREDLNEAQIQTLNLLLGYSPELKAAYALREELTAIFDAPISKGMAQTRLRTWIDQVVAIGVKCFDDFIKTLNRLWEPITNYFIARRNSAFVEGLNNRIKVLKRRCDGLFNLKHFFQRLYLDLNGYRLFSIRPPYVA